MQLKNSGRPPKRGTVSQKHDHLVTPWSKYKRRRNKGYGKRLMKEQRLKRKKIKEGAERGMRKFDTNATGNQDRRDPEIGLPI